MRNKYFEKWWLLFHAYEPSGTLPGCTHIRGTVHYCVAHEYVKPHCVPVSARVTENTQKPHPHPCSTWLSDDCHLLEVKREKGKGHSELVLWFQNYYLLLFGFITRVYDCVSKAHADLSYLEGSGLRFSVSRQQMHCASLSVREEFQCDTLKGRWLDL